MGVDPTSGGYMSGALSLGDHPVIMAGLDTS